jgi:site-specific DNA recombinase
VARIDVHRDHLMIGFRSADTEQTADTATDGHSLSIPWQKPPSRRARQILIPHGTPRSHVRPTRIERRVRLVSAIARGRRWLDEIISGAVTDVQQIATRQKCSVRQVNMTISLAFLAPIWCERPLKAACPAASASSVSAVLPPNGPNSSRPSVSIPTAKD